MECFMLDEEDLKLNIWTCEKYPSLHHDKRQDKRKKCDYVTKSARNFRVHLQRVHQSHHFPKSFFCPARPCTSQNKCFGSSKELRQHYVCLHAPADLQCPVCGKRLRSPKSFKRHVVDCKTGVFTCSCGVMYSSRSSLIRHQKLKEHESANLQVISPPTNTASNDKIQPENLEQDKVKIVHDYILVPVTQLGNEQYAILHNKNLYQINNPNHTNTPEPYSYQDKSVEVGTSQTYLNQGSEHQKRTSKWDNKSTSAALSRDWMNPQASLINPFSTDQNISSESDEDRVLHDRPLFSALDNIHTQTDNLWNITEFSTQTVTEQQSFGTQTANSCGAVLESLECVECDLVEYLDCCAQTDTMYKSTGKCFGAQTELAMVSEPEAAVTDVWSHNDQSSGVERSNMECQTLDKRNSTHTQTNMVRERGLQAGTHIETQTTIDLGNVYNESFTQTQESFELDYFRK